MICQRSGICCTTMDVVIPVVTDEGVRAKFKPGGFLCPHLEMDGMDATCRVHHLPQYEGSPCWTYGNSDVDPDFAVKRGRPCLVGRHTRSRGGLPVLYPKAVVATPEEMQDLGPWPELDTPESES